MSSQSFWPIGIYEANAIQFSCQPIICALACSTGHFGLQSSLLFHVGMSVSGNKEQVEAIGSIMFLKQHLPGIPVGLVISKIN